MMRISHFLRLKSRPRRSFFEDSTIRLLAEQSLVGSYGYTRVLLDRQLKIFVTKFVGSSTILAQTLNAAELLAPLPCRDLRAAGW